MSTFRTTRGPRGPMGMVNSAAWQVLLVAGLVAIALGIVILAWPHATLAVIGVIFGIYLLVTGVAQLLAAFASALPTSMRVLGFVSGALSVLLGLICFRGPLQSVLLLALWIGFSWLFRGVSLAASAASDSQVPARGWQVFLGVGIAIAGIVLIVSPFTSLTALTLVAGAWLIVVGVMELIAAIRAHAISQPSRHATAGA